jgi:AraC-like DNA-binding protein
VRVYAQRETDRTDSVVIEPCPARLEQMLEFQFGEPISCIQGGNHRAMYPGMIIGAVAQPCSISLPGGTISFGIFFHPIGLSRLLGIPMKEISLEAYDARDVAGHWLGSLQNQLAECRSFAERVLVAESLLLECAVRAAPPTTMQVLAAHVFSAQGSVRILDLARHLGLGPRQFERQFKEDIGVQPKLYSRISRFQSALDAKLTSPHRTWLEIALSFGYFDQMHMIRDFHGLAGDVPSRILSSIGDMRPPSVEST